MSLKLTDQIETIQENSGGKRVLRTFTEVNDLISAEEDGRLTDLETSVNTAGTGLLDRATALEATINTDDTGLVDRVEALETAAGQPMIATADTITEDDEDPSIDVTVTKDTFHEDNSAVLLNWVWIASNTGLVLSTVIWDSIGKVTVSFTGTAVFPAGGKLIALKEAFDGDRVQSTRLDIVIAELVEP